MQAVDIMDLLGSRCVHSHGMCTDVSLCMHNLTLLRFNRWYFALQTTWSLQQPKPAPRPQPHPLHPDPSSSPQPWWNFWTLKSCCPRWSFPGASSEAGTVVQQCNRFNAPSWTSFWPTSWRLGGFGFTEVTHAFTYHCLVDSKKHGLMASFIFCLMSSWLAKVRSFGTGLKKLGTSQNSLRWDKFSLGPSGNIEISKHLVT